VRNYLDASVLLPFFVKEPSSAAVGEFLGKRSEPPVISEFAAAEVASAVSRLVRTGRITAEEGRAVLQDFDVWRSGAAVEADLAAADARLANAYVRRFELMLKAPDALHLAVCQRLGLALATLDQRLASAAVAIGVRLSFTG
jgi:predicted nucleic acid-binding protein